MTIHSFQKITLLSANPAALATFWSKTFDTASRPAGTDLYSVEGPDGINGFLIQKATPAPTGTPRARFDLNVIGRGAEVTRLVALGAKNLGEKTDGGTPYTLLTDPDGNQIGLFDQPQSL